MKVQKKDLLVTGVTLTKSKKTNEPYLLISLMDFEDGSAYSLMEKNLEIMQKVVAGEKWKLNLKVSGTKYGVRLEITDYLEKVGQV